MRKKTVISGMVVCLVGAVLLFDCGSSKKVGVSQANVQSEFLAMKACAEKERGEYQLISLEDLKAKLDAKEIMLIIDTMPYEGKNQTKYNLEPYALSLS